MHFSLGSLSSWRACEFLFGFSFFLLSFLPFFSLPFFSFFLFLSLSFLFLARVPVFLSERLDHLFSFDLSRHFPISSCNLFLYFLPRALPFPRLSVFPFLRFPPRFALLPLSLLRPQTFFLVRDAPRACFERSPANFLSSPDLRTSILLALEPTRCPLLVSRYQLFPFRFLAAVFSQHFPFPIDFC